MSFMRRWMRDSLRASAVTLLVPVAVLAALLVTALGTGFGGLGSLRQLVSGPTIPETSGAAASAADRQALPAIPPVPARAASAPAPPPAAGAGALTPGARAVTRGPLPTPTPVRRPRPPQSSPPGTRPQRPEPVPVSPAPAPAPAPTPTLVQDIAQGLQGIVTPVAATLGSAVSGVLSTIERLLGGRPAGAATPVPASPGPSGGPPAASLRR